MFLTTGSAKHREKLSPLRAEAWADGITQKQYIERNERLYAHSFGKTRIESHVYLSESGEILSSCDTLDVEFAVLDPAEDVFIERGLLLAFVYTPVAERDKGAATRMLAELFAIEEGKSWCLHSDIPPYFYQRFGFRPTPIEECSELIASGPSRPFLKTVPLAEAVNGIREWRLSLFDNAETGLLLLPDALWVDWELEKFRVYAEFKKKDFPECCFQHGREFAIVAPDFSKDEIKVLFSTSSQMANESAQALISGTGLNRKFSWKKSETTTGEAPVPMAWNSLYPAATEFLDLQYGDWW